MVQQMISQQTEPGRRLQQQQQLHQPTQHVATKSKPANILGAATLQAIPIIQQHPQQGNFISSNHIVRKIREIRSSHHYYTISKILLF